MAGSDISNCRGCTVDRRPCLAAAAAGSGVPAASQRRSGLAAASSLRLPGDTLYVEPDADVDLGSPELKNTKLLGALLWQPERSLNIVPFATQAGAAAPFGHIVFDSSLSLDGPVLLHAGMVQVGQGGAMASVTDLESISLCGATLRAAIRLADVVVGALTLWWYETNS